MKAIRIIGIITTSCCIYFSWLLYYNKEPLPLLNTIWITSMAVYSISSFIKDMS